MKKIFFILFVTLNLVNFAQRGQTIPKGNTTKNTTSNNENNSGNTNYNSKSNIITITVSAATVPCTNNPNSQCLQIKRQNSDEFEAIEDIENFNYELGYIYTIQVKEITKTTPAKYIFVKLINKKEIEYGNQETKPDFTVIKTNSGKIIGQTNIQTTSALDGKWYLRKMKDSENSSFVTDDNVLWIEIKTFDNSIKGFGACNNFEAVLRTDNVSTFKIDKLTSGYLNCGNKKLENLFYDLLQETDGLEIKNGNLILSKRWNYLLGFTNNPNNKEEIITTYTPPNIVKKENTTYATNQNTNTNQDVYSPPVITSENTKTSTSSVTTTNTTDGQQVSSKETSTTSNAEVDEMQRKIDELQKALEAKKQKAEDDAKKTEEAKLAAAKAIEAKKEEEQKQAELQQQLVEKKKKEAAVLEQKSIAEKVKQKEIDDLKKQLAEKEKEFKDASNIPKPSSTQGKANTDSKESSSIDKQTTNDKKNKTQNVDLQPIITQETTSQKLTNNLDFVEPKTIEFVYSVKDKKIISLENTSAIFRGNDKSTYLELENSESSLQFIYNKLPKFIVKLNDNESPENYISLYSCDFKKEKRQIYVRPSKNKILNSFSKVANNEYEIILPENLGEGEYVFIKQSDLNTQFLINSTTIQVLCFGITYK